MPEPSFIEGEVDFEVPAAGKPCKTWYKVYGDLKCGLTPLIGISGGPGMPHDYILPFADLHVKYGIPLVLFDEVGSGRSTHFAEKRGDASFWVTELFVRELENLLAHLQIEDNYDLIGHSWGGMVGAALAVSQPKGLRRLVLANTPSDMHLWVEAQNLLRSQLPQEVQDTMKKHEDSNTLDSKEYREAMDFFFQRHLCRLPTFPPDVMAAVHRMMEDDTMMQTMNGPSEFHFTGTMKDWSIVSEAHKISVPTLLINGRYDQAQDSVVEPFFREVPKIKWVQFSESGHMPHFEERERFTQVVGGFLMSK